MINEFDLMKNIGVDEFLTELLWYLDDDTLQEICESIASDNQIYDEVLISNKQMEEV